MAADRDRADASLTPQPEPAPPPPGADPWERVTAWEGTITFEYRSNYRTVKGYGSWGGPDHGRYARHASCTFAVKGMHSSWEGTGTLSSEADWEHLVYVPANHDGAGRVVDPAMGDVAENAGGFRGAGRVDVTLFRRGSAWVFQTGKIVARGSARCLEDDCEAPWRGGFRTVPVEAEVTIDLSDEHTRRFAPKPLPTLEARGTAQWREDQRAQFDESHHEYRLTWELRPTKFAPKDPPPVAPDEPSEKPKKGGLKITSLALVDYGINRHKRVEITRLQYLSAAAHEYFGGNTRVHGGITLKGPKGDVVRSVELEVLQGGRVVAVGRLAPGARKALLGELPAGGLSFAAGSEPLFELPSAQAAKVDGSRDGTVELRVRAKSDKGGTATRSYGSVQILVLYTNRNRYGERDEAAGGDGWVRPSVKRLIEHYPDLVVGDISNMNGGAFDHSSHRDGIDVDLSIAGYNARTADVARRLVAFLDDPDYGPSIRIVYVTFTRAFRAAVREMTLADGRPATAVITHELDHDTHFHWRIAAPVPEPGTRPRRPPPPGDPQAGRARRGRRRRRTTPEQPRAQSLPVAPLPGGATATVTAAAATASSTAAEENTALTRGREWPGTLFLIESAGSETVHLLSDCPALRRATHDVVERPGHSASGPVAAAAEFALPPCGTCLRMLGLPVPEGAAGDDCLYWGESGSEWFAVFRDRFEHGESATWIRPERVTVVDWDDVAMVVPKGPGIFTKPRILIVHSNGEFQLPFDDVAERDELYAIAAAQFDRAAELV